MVASFEGKADIVHKLIWANADTDAQNQVANGYLSSYTVKFYIYVIALTGRVDSSSSGSSGWQR